MIVFSQTHTVIIDQVNGGIDFTSPVTKAKKFP